MVILSQGVSLQKVYYVYGTGAAANAEVDKGMRQVPTRRRRCLTRRIKAMDGASTTGPNHA